MLARYHESEQDGDLLALKAEIALLDARLLDVLSRVDSGESSQLWSQLRTTYRHLEHARRDGDTALLASSLADLGDLITCGHADWATWADVRSLIRDRQRLVESERKRMVEARQMISVEQAMALLGLLVDAVRRHVTDDATLRAVTNEYARLIGQPSPLAALPEC